MFPPLSTWLTVDLYWYSRLYVSTPNLFLLYLLFDAFLIHQKPPHIFVILTAPPLFPDSFLAFVHLNPPPGLVYFLHIFSILLIFLHPNRNRWCARCSFKASWCLVQVWVPKALCFSSVIFKGVPHITTVHGYNRHQTRSPSAPLWIYLRYLKSISFCLTLEPPLLRYVFANEP